MLWPIYLRAHGAVGLYGCYLLYLPLQAIASFVHSRHMNGRRTTLALRDYWPYWRENLEAASAGKVVPCYYYDGKRSDEGVPPHLWPIVFDDNVFHDDAHIIDMRDATTGNPLPFNHVIGKYLVRAEPYYAILDPQNYFKQEFERCLAAADRSLQP